eukprot:XP_001709673.1 Hypothetical protein GL50803_100851 [Giardia lamblia ATCC 50803]
MKVDGLRKRYHSVNAREERGEVNEFLLNISGCLFCVASLLLLQLVKLVVHTISGPITSQCLQLLNDWIHRKGLFLICSRLQEQSTLFTRLDMT